MKYLLTLPVLVLATLLLLRADECPLTAPENESLRESGSGLMLPMD